jgi:hypothetical protein
MTTQQTRDAWAEFIESLPLDQKKTTDEQEIARLTQLAMDHGLIRSTDHVANDHVATTPDVAVSERRETPNLDPAQEVRRLVALAQESNLTASYGLVFGSA